ncbi:peptidylprolyl isomerase [Mesonia sp. MT50]|uniref:Peptidylprolyl isomerase n=1 Tax=Mesonia profundi TaxID=3070998 RepID=A0ABU0ZZ80_9FLAO|nr:peptidylprolyl isomerase [Mesonia profundi]MDQ7916757.1 peptidylprolyl isomerase [Mesonia profundi]
MKNLLLLVFLATGCIAFAQKKEQKVLLTINDQPVYADEFKRVFSKNLNLLQDDQKDVSEYMDLFVDYKLKVLEAETQGLDTLPSFMGEYNIYKKQLADKYMKDSEITENLLQEAYSRKKQEVNASHILINVTRNASAKDTLKAYQKAMKARKEILNGKSFAEVAKTYSEDPSVEKNNGDLGWFTVFSMVYPFETAAYETKVGEVSMPARSQFGYHIVKVNDKRKAEGTVKVAHIMIENKEGNSDAKTQIFEIKEKLDNGNGFSEMARQYSDDKNTAVNGGVINTFSRGKLNSGAFENVAFGLTEIDETSTPFETEYGWHIVKLLNKNTIKSFEDEKQDLSRRMKGDVRAQLIREDVLKDIQNTYTIKEDEAALAYFSKNVSDALLSSKWDINNLKDIPQKNIIEIKGEGKSYQDFAKLISNSQRQIGKVESKESLLKQWLILFKENFLISYHKEHLAETDAEYAYIIQEYRNGLLLFELMEDNIWQAAKKDSVALQTYYQQHQKEFTKEKTYTLTMASTDTKKMAKQVRKWMKKGVENDTIEKDAKEMGHSVLFKSGEFQEDHDALPSKIKDRKGVSKLYENNGVFLVFDIENIEPEGIKTFEEARGEVVSQYQQQLEKEWIENIRAKNNVVINQEVLKSLEKEFE